MGKQQHVVIAGAGIVGVSSAIWLQRAGHRVTLVDREGPAAGTSYGNAGILAAGAFVPVTVPGLWKKAPGMLFNPNEPLFMRWRYFPKLIPFLMKYMAHCTREAGEHYAAAMADLLGDSVDQHHSLAAGTGAEKYLTGLDYCFGYKTRGEFEKDGYGWAVRKRHGAEFEVVTGEEFAAYDPLYAGKFETVVRCKNHGSCIDPGEYIKTLAAHFADQGGTIEIANIQGITKDPATGHAAALKTDKGEFSGDHVVITLGARAKPAAKDMGLKPDLEAERGYHIELVNPSAMPKAPMMCASYKFVVSPMAGRIRCAGVVEFGGLTDQPSKAPLELIKRQFSALFPGITYDRIDTWLGHRPATPNSLPMIGPSPDLPNAYIGVGHQHLGLTGGPKTGRILAGLISGKPPNTDLSPFSPALYK